MRTPTLDAAAGRYGSAALWYALFGGAAAWFTALCVGWFIVTPSCAAETELYLHVISIVTVAAGVGAAVTGGLLWRASEASWPDDGGGRRDRTRFVAAVGTVLSSLFTLVMLAQWAGVVVHGPCRPLPRLQDSPDAYIQPCEVLRPV